MFLFFKNSMLQYSKIIKLSEEIFLMEKTEQPAPVAPAEKAAPVAEAPAEVTTPAQPVAADAPAAPKKKKTGLIITIVIVILALIGGGVAAFFLLRKNPSDVVADAFVNTAKTLASKDANLDIDGSIKVDASSMLSAEATFKGKIAKNGDGKVEFGVDLMGTKVSADFAIKDKKAYVKLNNVNSLVSMLTMFGVDLPAGTSSIARSINDKWFYTDFDYVEQNIPAIESLEKIKDKEISKEQFNDYFEVESYNGDVVSAKNGDLYKVTFKDKSIANNTVDSIYVEVKSNNIVRLFAAAEVSGISTIIDLSVNYPDSVDIEIPSNAKDLMELFGNGSSSRYSNILDDDEDDLDEDDLDEDDYKTLLKMLED